MDDGGKEEACPTDRSAYILPGASPVLGSHKRSELHFPGSYPLQREVALHLHFSDLEHIGPFIYYRTYKMLNIGTDLFVFWGDDTNL